MNKPVLTQKRLKELLHYEPLTGDFTWVKPGPKVRVGEIAGWLHPSSGYRYICLEGKSYKSHRLSFLYVEGYFPEHDVDHKDGNRSENSWKNLRHSTRSCNLQNTCVRSNNKSGFPGVSWVKRSEKWIAQATLQGKAINIGQHENRLEAALARLTWEVHCEYWTCNNRGELAKAVKSAWPEFKEQSIN